jgi:hypothetical protein
VADERVDPPDEEFSVRLSWPKPGAAAAPATPAAPPTRATPAGPRTRATVRTPQPRIEAPRADDSDPAEAGSAPQPFAREARTPEAHLAAAGTDSTSTGKVFVEAFDRLADRLLDRLRTIRQDVDTDLTGVRNELAALRQAVEELGERAQVRQLHTDIDELRTELAALRRAVLEWPELEQVSNDIAAVRGDLAFLFEASGEGAMGGAPSDLLAELQRTIGTLSDEITRMGKELPQLEAVNAVLEEVVAVRSELTQVRRRVGVRKGPLNDEQLEQIVSAVADRVLDELQHADSRRRRR